MLCKVNDAILRYDGLFSFIGVCSPLSASNYHESFTAHPFPHRQWTQAPTQKLSKISIYTPRSFPSTLTQNAVCRNRTHAPRPIRPVRLDRELPLLARAHIQESLIPAFNDLPASNNKAEGWPAVVTGVELAAVALEGSAVMDVHFVASFGGATTFGFYDNFGLEVLSSC